MLTNHPFLNFYRVFSIFTPSPTYPSINRPRSTTGTASSCTPTFFAFRHFYAFYYCKILGFSSSTAFISKSHRKNSLAGRNTPGPLVHHGERIDGNVRFFLAQDGGRVASILINSLLMSNFRSLTAVLPLKTSRDV